MTTEPALFDADRYGPGRAARQRRAHVVDEIKLLPPWVLLGHARTGPMAHLLHAHVRPNKDGAYRTRCGRLGYLISVDGRPMAKVCHACWDMAVPR